jgi:dienelactone hydrolase
VVQGKFMKVGGANTYVAAGTEGGSPPTKAVVVVTDAFGAQFVNNQLLAGRDPPRCTLTCLMRSLSRKFAVALRFISCQGDACCCVCADDFAREGFLCVVPDIFAGKVRL